MRENGIKKNEQKNAKYEKKNDKNHPNFSIRKEGIFSSIAQFLS